MRHKITHVTAAPPPAALAALLSALGVTGDEGPRRDDEFTVEEITTSDPKGRTANTVSHELAALERAGRVSARFSKVGGKRVKLYRMTP